MKRKQSNKRVLKNKSDNNRLIETFEGSFPLKSETLVLTKNNGSDPKSEEKMKTSTQESSLPDQQLEKINSWYEDTPLSQILKSLQTSVVSPKKKKPKYSSKIGEILGNEHNMFFLFYNLSIECFFRIINVLDIN